MEVLSWEGLRVNNSGRLLRLQNCSLRFLLGGILCSVVAFPIEGWHNCLNQINSCCVCHVANEFKFSSACMAWNGSAYQYPIPRNWSHGRWLPVEKLLPSSCACLCFGQPLKISTASLKEAPNSSFTAVTVKLLLCSGVFCLFKHPKEPHGWERSWETVISLTSYTWHSVIIRFLQRNWR